MVNIKMDKNSKVSVIIVAAGSGVRLGNQTPKQYLPLNGKVILEQAIEKFLNNKNIDNIQLVVSREHEIYFKLIVEKYNIQFCFGGASRQESVRLGLEAIFKNAPNKILIHDAARPFVNDEIIDAVVEALETEKAVIPVKKLKDTIKEISGDYIGKTHNRENFVLVETPQGFKFDLIYYLHQKFKNENFTDDASLCEAENIAVKYIAHNFDNSKITTQEDFLKYNKMQIRVGNGFDVHAFEEGEHLILCGVKIPFNKKFKAHSDGDVAWHALTDAILGAIGKGDIGEIFPDNDPKWKNANSIIFLQKATELMKEQNFEISNIDITIIAEKPKLFEFKNQMKINTANALGISSDKVNIKATTTEKLGFTGRGEGLAVQASVSINSI
jgi:2-C-methyl-D-erythritol 4-phosphate cytidylyltransferase/2-C-methyl-D-erythritol 2,4-cyclodiphosphate synthase